MNPAFVPKVQAPDVQSEPVYWFIFRGFRLLVDEKEAQTQTPYIRDVGELGLTAVRQLYLGYMDLEDERIHCYAAEVGEETEAPGEMEFYGLRSLYGRLPERQFWLAGRAVQIVDWDRTHRFCGRCGAPTKTQAHERAKKCPDCGHSAYPRLSPAIIVAVTRPFPGGNRLLLARSWRHPKDLFSVLAGFVEPGETLETAVRREVKEETNIDVKNIRYFGSQPWPFPNSLMIAFTAEYAGGEIELEEEEMEEAGWYAADMLPRVPPPISISRQLIDWFVTQNTD